MKGIWPSERVNSQVDWLRGDLSGTSAPTFTDKYFGQSQEFKKTLHSDSLFLTVSCLISVDFSLTPRSLLHSLSFGVLSQAVSTLLLSALFLFHALDFHSHLMSPYFCWPAEHIKAPLTPHCPGKIGGRERNFSSQSSTATRQYETLITKRSGLGNGLL